MITCGLLDFLIKTRQVCTPDPNVNTVLIKCFRVMLNGASPMLSWNVQDYDAADVLSFVRTLPQPQRDFLLSRYVPAGYLSLEHTLVSLARVYSADRANA